MHQIHFVSIHQLDKASVLEDATKHIEELQERLKTLEEGEKNNSTAPNTMVERCIISTCSDNTSSFKGTTLEQIPEIKVKIQGKSVLIKILCEKKYYGSISSMSTELEKLHLTILDTRILRFGSCTLDITLKAQVLSTSLLESFYGTNSSRHSKLHGLHARDLSSLVLNFLGFQV